MRLVSQCGNMNFSQRSNRWSNGIFVSNTLTRHDTFNFFCSVYSNLGLGFASGCIIIIAEIIYSKLTNPRRMLRSGCGTILLLLILSAILTTATVLMIKAYFYPLYFINQNIQYYNPIVDYHFKKGTYERFNSLSSSLYFSVSGTQTRKGLWPTGHFTGQ